MALFNAGDYVTVTEPFLGYATGHVWQVVEDSRDLDDTGVWLNDKFVMARYMELNEPWVLHTSEVDEPSSDEQSASPRNKYMREIAPGVWVDVYDVLYAFNVTDPCLQHLIKKALATGVRGHKSEREDLVDIVDSAKRAVEHYDRFN